MFIHQHPTQKWQNYRTLIRQHLNKQGLKVAFMINGLQNPLLSISIRSNSRRISIKILHGKCRNCSQNEPIYHPKSDITLASAVGLVGITHADSSFSFTFFQNIVGLILSLFLHVFFHGLFYFFISLLLTNFDSNFFCIYFHICLVFVCLLQTFSNTDSMHTLFLIFFLSQIILRIDFNSFVVTFFVISIVLLRTFSVFSLIFYSTFYIYSQSLTYYLSLFS